MKKQLLLFFLMSIFSINIYAQFDKKAYIDSQKSKISTQSTHKPIVKTAVYSDVSRPLRDMKPLKSNDYKQWKSGIVKNYFRTLPYNPFEVYSKEAVLQTSGQDVIVNDPELIIEGSSNSDNPYLVVPPDPTGDVGLNHYVQMVNNVTQIFDKDGNSSWGPYVSSAFWDGFTGAWTGTNDGDPVVLYDQQADRWFVTQFAVNTTNGTQWELIAVSTSPDPTDSYYRYAFQFTDMPDYPKFGIWPDGYYMSANRFTVPDGNFNGTYACAFERDKMLTGDNARMILFENSASTNTMSLLPSDCDGDFPEIGTPNYFVYDEDDDTYWTADNIVIYAFDADWDNINNSTFTLLTSLDCAAFNSNFTSEETVSVENNIKQLGTLQKLDILNDRMMFRNQYRKFDTHETMVLNRTVNIGDYTAGIRWYELRKQSGNWEIYQQSTYSPNVHSRWMGSIAMNGLGEIALGFSISSKYIYPSIKYTGRKAFDPLNTMSISEKMIHSGENFQDRADRWGDYSTMSVDPSDDKTFWYTNEYSGGGWSWKTKIAKFSFVDEYSVQNFKAKASGTDAINLSWDYSDFPVLIAWSADGVFGQPVDGGTYSEGYNIDGGGTVLGFLNGDDEITHSNLSAGQNYFYKIWAYKPDKTYSIGEPAFESTPTGSPENFNAETYSKSQINLTWEPYSQSKEVLLAVSSNGLFGNPTDNNTYSVGQTLAGGGEIIYTGSDSAYYHSSLISNSKYYYRIWTKYSDGTYSLYAADNAYTAADTIFFDDFESTVKWTLNGEWEIASPEGLGGSYGMPDPETAYAGSKILGLDLSGLGSNHGDYETNLAAKAQYAVSNSVNCSEYTEVKLKYKRWLGVESSEFDHAYIEISVNNGAWTTIWQNPTETISDNNWQDQEIDISNYADGESNVKFRYVIGATDEGWEYCGWNIDNFEIVGTKNIQRYSADFYITDQVSALPVEGAKIEVNGNTVLTDSEGKATVLLENGTYSYTISAFGYIEKNDNITVAGNTVVNQTINPIDRYTVNFNVKNNLSENIENASVILNGQTLLTDVSGNVSISYPEGTHNFDVTADGYISKFNQEFTVNGSDLNVNVVIDPLPVYNLTFTVTDGTNSTPIDGALFVIEGLELPTNSSGVCTYALKDGKYQYTVSYAGYGTKTGEVVVSGADSNYEIALYPAVNTVSVNVKEADGVTPIIGAAVTFNGVEAVTDVSGKAVFSNIAKGNYLWKVVSGAYYTELGSAEVNDTDIEFDVLMNLVGSGVENVKENMFNIYPNPNKGKFIITFDKVVSSTVISVIDISGKTVYKNIASNVIESEIDLTDKVKGIYFVNVKSDDNVFTTKIIIE